MKKPDAPDHLASDEWITAAEAAQIVGVTPDHIRHLARAGQLTTRRFGHAWMISRSSAEAYAATDRTPGPKRQE